jgi:excisionase family DNA binding protein
VNRQATNPIKLLTVEAAADRLSTAVRFIRGIIAERRTEFVKVGRHVRISEAALQDFIDAGRVQPMTVAAGSGGLERTGTRQGEARGLRRALDYSATRPAPSTSTRGS